MKKAINILLIISLLIGYFIPVKYDVINADACGGFQVSVAGVNAKEIGCYTTYSAAFTAMNNYASTATNVAVISKNNKIVYAKYGIVKFIAGQVVSLYTTASGSTVYTSVHSSYGTDAAFIDFDSTNNRVKLRISGYTGWADLSTLNIVPISQFGSKTIKVNATIGSNVRQDHSTSSTKLGAIAQGSVYQYYDKYTGYDANTKTTYTWYKINYNGSYGWIANYVAESWLSERTTGVLQTYYEHYSTGNLIHYYEHSTGQGWTNLGPSPSYLNRGTSYYSFDGNYFYTDLVKMLTDYRNGNYNNAVNKSDPHFPYYLYLPNHSKTGNTAEDFDKIVREAGYTNSSQSAMYGQGANFIASQEKYGVNALLTFSAAVNESDMGTSAIAKDKNNLFGHGAYDSCPYSCATVYPTVKDSIFAHAKMTGEGFNSPNDWRYYGSHYGNKASGMNIKYATDPYWGEKAAMNAYLNSINYGSSDYMANTLGIKTSLTNVNVEKNPEATNSPIYKLYNSTYGISVMNVPVIVFDKVYDKNNVGWYKVYTDAALNDNRQIANVDYSFDKSYGYIREDYLYVKNKQPVITASDKTIAVGATLNLLSGVTATDTEDGNLTNRIEYVGTVDTSKEGKYTVTYSVEDKNKFRASKTITITVIDSGKPVINANNLEVSQYTVFNPLTGVTATDIVDGNLTNSIEVISNNVNTNNLGTYTVKYRVTNSAGKVTEKEIAITVVPNEKPIITSSDRTINLNSTFNPLDGVVASDKEDGDITNKITIVSNNVDTTKEGTYTVVYSVKDLANQTTTKQITVTVIKKTLVLKTGNFYFEHLKVIDNKLNIKGYQTINGINNTLATAINYKLQFVNLSNKSLIFEQPITRITDDKEITRPVPSTDGKDYKYSWFKGDINLANIPQGDYKVYIIAESDDYYSKSIISNKLFKTQITNFSGDKHVIIRNNYRDNDIPLEFVIRNEKLGTKASLFEYNQFDQYRTFEFTSDNKLNIKGTSFSYGGDYSTKATINRKIIFENTANYQKYEYTLGSITNGLYTVKLTTSDGFDKTRAWYDAKIDLSNIPIGNYAIYVSNQTNISDIGELNELLFRDLSTVKKTINGKEYSFKINDQLGYRIEMNVK